ncbi:hypothetical protein [uncultured Salegentibacter sp.]|uniref:hypothetical protein n=1 Tax=uncultured Salegentibacter sp. TaxID=259320 RepID=UPI0025943FBC|nr:hypothetical protein [uncultured Salegentibacter sp.]
MALFENLLFDIEIFLKYKNQYKDQLEQFYADDLTISILKKVQKPIFYFGNEGKSSKCLYRQILIDSEYLEINRLSETLYKYLPLINKELAPTISDKCNKEEDLNRQNTPLQTIENLLYSLHSVEFQIKVSEGILDHLSNIIDSASIGNTEVYARKISYLMSELRIRNKMLSHSNNPTTQEETEIPEEIFEANHNNYYNRRIIFLKELGILDHLRKFECFQASTNAMAAVVSSFTNIPTTTVQSYLNPIFSSGTKQANNPLNEKNIKEVRQDLINFGFEPEDQNKS